MLAGWPYSEFEAKCWDGRSSELERNLGSRIVTYADHLVILCRKGKAEEALQRLREIVGRLKLTINEAKTRRIRASAI